VAKCNRESKKEATVDPASLKWSELKYAYCKQDELLNNETFHTQRSGKLTSSSRAGVQTLAPEVPVPAFSAWPGAPDGSAPPITRAQPTRPDRAVAHFMYDLENWGT